jgi:4'-phosphopantetheinyl transferase
LGRWTAKRLLVGSGYFAALEMDDFQIDSEAGGQPYVVNSDGQRLPGCLSISHSSGNALCAFCPEPGALVGADVEKVSPKEAVFIDDYLSQGERQAALTSAPEQRDLLVTLAWSLKESVFKALGKGLRLDTRCVTVEGLKEATAGQLPAVWTPISLSGEALPRPYQAWWMQADGFVLTLVCLTAEPVELVEVR